MKAGYATREYAEALAEFGRPRHLAGCHGWLLERPTPALDATDAMGCYPLFACEDWHLLAQDLHELGGSLVSVVLVADPFGNHDQALLGRAFNRGAVPFKEHQVVTFRGPLEGSISSHHRRNVRKASRAVEVERLARPADALDDWCRLYRALVDRHAIEGISAFSRASFESQLKVPGIRAYRAAQGGQTVGMVLFYVAGETAYYHLGAYSDDGYKLGAAFAIFWAALQELASEVRCVTLGGDAGLSDSGGGLSRFKRGWANDARTAYLCRHVGDAEAYERLSRGSEGATFFPAYRAPVTVRPGEADRS